MLLTVALQLALIVLCAIFARAEVATLSLNKASLEKLSETGDKRAMGLLNAINKNDKYVVSALVTAELMLMIGCAFSVYSFAPSLSRVLVGESGGAWAEVCPYICVLAVALVVAAVSISFGELIPRRATLRDPQATAVRLFGFVRVAHTLLFPMIFVISGITALTIRMLGISAPAVTDESVAEERIKRIIDSGNERGAIDNMEHQMIKNIFEFDDISVSEVCTHRRDVNFLYRDDDISAWHDWVSKTRHNYYPVCGENTDDVIGILSVRKFFRADCPNTEVAIKLATDPPFFVPETMKADVLFNKMKEKRTYFAVVIDEYGGTRGVITIHDLLELLVGEMEDSGEETVEEIKELGDGKWEILGSASLDDVSEALGVEIDDEDHDTFGGYVVGALGSIPQDGKEVSLETERFSIRVLSVSEHRIERTEVVKKDIVSEDQKEREA